MPCTSKPWITTAIADSIKSKNKIYKKYYKEKKKTDKGKFTESSSELIGTILQHYSESQRMNVTKLILRKIKFENHMENY